MPDGVVQWFDPTSGQAAIVRAGHVYAAETGDIESVARHAGARVHFDIRRDGGGEHAVTVRLRSGKRVSHHQRRYGTLVGARRADTKGSAPFARPHPERGRALASHPLEVARAWVDCLQRRDLDGALSFYAPDAVLHADGEEYLGRSHLGPYLEANPLFGMEHEPDIRGDEGLVLVRWADRDAPAVSEVRARVEHGLIAEQWVGDIPPAGRTIEVGEEAGRIAVAVLSHGRIEDDDVDYAAGRLGVVLSHIDEPVLFARLKLSRFGDPARAKPAVAQAAVDVNGQVIRAHVAAAGIREAADLLERRLKDKLQHRAEHRDDLRKRSGTPEPGEWRHGDLPTVRPDFYDRPPEERELVRHRTFDVDELTPDEAAFDMEQLDYDFHLFRELASGEDAVLERAGDGGYRLTRLHPTAVDLGPLSISLEVSDGVPPELTLADAMERYDASGEPFLFFANAATGRGNVLYRRYDGNYGLITAA